MLVFDIFVMDCERVSFGMVDVEKFGCSVNLCRLLTCEVTDSVTFFEVPAFTENKLWMKKYSINYNFFHGKYHYSARY